MRTPCGLRTVVTILEIFAELLGDTFGKVPCYNTVENWVKKLGLNDLKVFVSGNNLWLWTRMPDDRESNFSSYGGATGAYPTMKRINFGIKFNL